MEAATSRSLLSGFSLGRRQSDEAYTLYLHPECYESSVFGIKDVWVQPGNLRVLRSHAPQGEGLAKQGLRLRGPEQHRAPAPLEGRERVCWCQPRLVQLLSVAIGHALGQPCRRCKPGRRSREEQASFEHMSRVTTNHLTDFPALVSVPKFQRQYASDVSELPGVVQLEPQVLTPLLSTLADVSAS